MTTWTDMVRPIYFNFVNTGETSDDSTNIATRADTNDLAVGDCDNLWLAIKIDNMAGSVSSGVDAFQIEFKVQEGVTDRHFFRVRFQYYSTSQYAVYLEDQKSGGSTSTATVNYITYGGWFYLQIVFNRYSSTQYRSRTLGYADVNKATALNGSGQTNTGWSDFTATRNWYLSFKRMHSNLTIGDSISGMIGPISANSNGFNDAGYWDPAMMAIQEAMLTWDNLNEPWSPTDGAIKSINNFNFDNVYTSPAEVTQNWQTLLGIQGGSNTIQTIVDFIETLTAQTATQTDIGGKTTTDRWQTHMNTTITDLQTQVELGDITLPTKSGNDLWPNIHNLMGTMINKMATLLTFGLSNIIGSIPYIIAGIENSGRTIMINDRGAFSQWVGDQSNHTIWEQKSTSNYTFIDNLGYVLLNILFNNVKGLVNYGKVRQT